MGAISKYSNIYTKDGQFLHRPGKYNITEVEELLDKLSKDKPNSTEYNNTFKTLLGMYEKYGNPHKNEIIQKINDYAKSKTTKEEVVNAIKEVENGQ